MTTAGVQPFCGAKSINLGFFDWVRVFHKSVTEKNIAIYLNNNQFCLIWKSETVSFSQAIKEMKDNLKIVDIFIPEGNVNFSFKYEFIPKKMESHLTNFVVYNLETHNTDRARPYVFSFYRMSKLAGKHNK